MSVAVLPKEDFTHEPVLLNEVISFFRLLPQDKELTIVDCTLGLGGHSKILLETFPKLSIIGIDQDLQALEIAENNLAQFKDRIEFVHAPFSNLRKVLEHPVDGYLYDLGVSSMQLDDPERGFSYEFSDEYNGESLDMRMNQDNTKDAQLILSEYSEDKLTKIFRDFGEERYAKNIAHKIVEFRKNFHLETNQQLNTIIKDSIPRNEDPRKTYKRIYQALRIETNHELDELTLSLEFASHNLHPLGIIQVISYHSLEDRLVKKFFKNLSETNQLFKFSLPFDTMKTEVQFQNLNKSARSIMPRESEVAKNPRAHSAHLRAVQKKEEKSNSRKL